MYEKEDLLESDDNLIVYFRPFDQMSPEALCGFIDKPNEKDDSIYLHETGYTSLSDLDVDFEGYVTMLCESRAYKNWPYILLYIQDDKLDNDLIKLFKNDMSQLFPDFDWNAYVEKYESLRLSKK